MRSSQQVCWGGLPFPPPGDHVLSELSTMTPASWAALHSMTHGFTEFCKPLCHDKAVSMKGQGGLVCCSPQGRRVRQLGEWKTKMTTITITKLYITSQEFASLMTESLYRLTDIYLCPPTPKPMATTILLSTSVSFMFSDATYKWDHKVFVFLWLISLSIMSSRLIHVITSGRIPLIFWLNNIPLYLHITFSLSILPLMDFRLFQYLGYCEKCYFPRGRREEHEI